MRHRHPDRRSGRRLARPAGLIEAHRHDRDGASGRGGCRRQHRRRCWATPQSVQLLEEATPTRTTGSTLEHLRPVRGALADLRPPLRGERCAHTARTRPLKGALPSTYAAAAGITSGHRHSAARSPCIRCPTAAAAWGHGVQPSPQRPWGACDVVLIVGVWRGRSSSSGAMASSTVWGDCPSRADMAQPPGGAGPGPRSVWHPTSRKNSGRTRHIRQWR